MGNEELVVIRKEDLRKMITDIIRTELNSNNKQDLDEYITAKEASERFGGNYQTYLNRREAGQYQNVKRIGNTYYFSVNELKRGK